MIWYGFFFFLGYLLGGIPSGLLVGKVVGRGIDIRRYGSRRIGAANVLRTLGFGPSVAVFWADLAKGLVPVLWARLFLGDPWTQVAAALGATAGHNWSMYIGFQGGRGVTTGLGGLVVISPLVAAVTTFVAAGLILRFRYVSLGSMGGTLAGLAAMATLVVMGREPRAYIIYGVITAGIIIFQHRDNIQRLINGTERRLGNPTTPMGQQ